MTETSVTHVETTREWTPVRVRLRRAFRRARAAILPRRWVIPWEMRDNSRIYAQAVAEARARNASRDEIQSLEAGRAYCYWELEEELEMLESNRLLDQASKFMLATPEIRLNNPGDPDSDPNWRRGTHFKPTWYLRREAMQELRARIRAERKARLEPVGAWVKLVGAIIGGAGGATYIVEKLVGLMHR